MRLATDISCGQARAIMLGFKFLKRHGCLKRNVSTSDIRKRTRFCIQRRLMGNVEQALSCVSIVAELLVARGPS